MKDMLLNITTYNQRRSQISWKHSLLSKESKKSNRKRKRKNHLCSDTVNNSIHAETSRKHTSPKHSNNIQWYICKAWMLPQKAAERKRKEAFRVCFVFNCSGFAA